MTEPFETIRFDVGDGLARLRLNRPDRLNAMTNQMVEEVHAALVAASTDLTIRVLELTGEGRGFCPGADLDHYAARRQHPDGPGDPLDPECYHVATLLHDMPAVTVAAVNGACAGAGMGWAMACDLRVMSSSAKMNTAFLSVAVAGDMGMPWTLSRIVGSARARELTLLPGKIDADAARAFGLVSRVHPEETFRDEVDGLVRELLDRSPAALRTLKQNLLLAERTTLEDFVTVETHRHQRLVRGDESVAAFRDHASRPT